MQRVKLDGQHRSALLGGFFERAPYLAVVNVISGDEVNTAWWVRDGRRQIEFRAIDGTHAA